MRALAFVLLAGCAAGSSSVPATRFVNAPVVEAVNDRSDVPKKPQSRVLVAELNQFDGSFFRRMTRGLEARGHERSLGVNAFDEVPDSTWFTNRIGRRTITPEELRAAPGGVGSPEAHKPWTIISSKIGGLSDGFIVKDARGEKFILKFDMKGKPETESATHVIVGKLLWACGYNVTEDYVVYVRPDELLLAPDAKIKTQFGTSKPLDRREFDRIVSGSEISADGSIRGLASRLLDGKPLGGHASEGVRRDDPNDRISHNRRRDMRGAYAIFAWLDHSDMHEGNTLDMWVADPKDPRRHYVKHYLVDFGKALGMLAWINRDPRRGYEWAFDPGAMATQIASLGTHDRDWEHRTDPGLIGVGSYDVGSYNPGKWKAFAPSYVAFLQADNVDKFWGSKILIQLTPEHIRAAVDSARLSDPRAATYLTNAIIARQRKTARYWFRQVNPLDHFTVGLKGLCFDDLALVHKLEHVTGTQYAVTAFDAQSRGLWRIKPFAAQQSGATCVPLELAPQADGYTIVEITTTRPAFERTMYVHVARAPGSNAPRVVGIWRE